MSFADNYYGYFNSFLNHAIKSIQIDYNFSSLSHTKHLLSVCTLIGWAVFGVKFVINAFGEFIFVRNSRQTFITSKSIVGGEIVGFAIREECSKATICWWILLMLLASYIDVFTQFICAEFLYKHRLSFLSWLFCCCVLVCCRIVLNFFNFIDLLTMAIFLGHAPGAWLHVKRTMAQLLVFGNPVSHFHAHQTNTFEWRHRRCRTQFGQSSGKRFVGSRTHQVSYSCFLTLKNIKNFRMCPPGGEVSYL